VDFTIADMTADHRAPTPSAAAELLSPDQREWQQQLQALEIELGARIRRVLAGLGTELAHLRRRLKHPGFQLREQAQRLDDLEQRLRVAHRHRLGGFGHRLEMLEQRLQARSPIARISGLRTRHHDLEQRLTQAARQRLQRAGTRLGHLGRLLASLSPLTILDRGYAIVSDQHGAVVMDAEKVEPGDRVQARLARGRLEMTVDAAVRTD
jgi:exodeoxyribonuclease VII large subunit